MFLNASWISVRRKEILTKAKPHIGTDNLRNIVTAIRKRIIELGGEVRFDTALTDLAIANGKVQTISAGDKDEKVSALILAIGHSARDTFELLQCKNIFLEPKPFSVGTRIEHKQAAVDESLYGDHAGNPLLPKGEYQLSWRDKSGRGVYTLYVSRRHSCAVSFRKRRNCHKWHERVCP